MFSRLTTLTLLLSSLLVGSSFSAPDTLRLPTGKDAFFVEHDYAYRRFLWLKGDGSYRQIDQVDEVSVEADHGTWDQDISGLVRLHYTRGSLRFHALLSGPLSVNLRGLDPTATLPAAIRTIAAWLGQSNDSVYAAESLREIAVAPLRIALDSPTGTFQRAALQDLSQQMTDFLTGEQHQTTTFELVKIAGLPRLLVQRDAVFRRGNVARVLAEYHVKLPAPPPFYFAQVDAATFAKEAGNWQEEH